jgi:pyruvyltransferase
MKNLYLFVSNNFNNEDGSAKILGNLGDMISYYIIKHLTNKNNLSINIIPINSKTPENFIKNGKVLVLVGSTINQIHTIKTNEDIFLMGCGNINGNTIKIPNNVKILGVRGELTKKSLIYNDNIDVISDPGLLISEVFPVKKTPTKKIGYIIHSVDREKFFLDNPDLKIDLVNNYQEPEKFIYELLDYEKIISSSLHGIIFSNSYNKEVVGIRITDKIMGGDFKYKDYYQTIGNSEFSRVDVDNYSSNFDGLFNMSYKHDKSIIDDIKKKQINVITKFLLEYYG